MKTDFRINCMKEKNNYIIYHGIPCEIIEDYCRPGDGPYLKIRSSEDIDKAYSLGFTCMGYPDEIMKKVDLGDTGLVSE